VRQESPLLSAKKIAIRRDPVLWLRYATTTLTRVQRHFSKTKPTKQVLNEPARQTSNQRKQTQRVEIIETKRNSSRRGLIHDCCTDQKARKKKPNPKGLGLICLKIPAEPTFALVGTIIGLASLTFVFGMGTCVSSQVIYRETAGGATESPVPAYDEV
jgi:hypothetical protein